MSLLELMLLAILATYRITFLLHNERGPADVFTRFRTRIGVKYDQHSNPYGTNWLAEGVLCFFCLSVWVAFGAALLLLIGYLTGHLLLAEGLLLPFAFSGGAIFLKKWGG